MYTKSFRCQECGLLLLRARTVWECPRCGSLDIESADLPTFQGPGFVTVERDIPLPRPSGLKYPWHEMEHGDSVLLPLRARQAAGKWLGRNRPGWKARARAEGEEMVRIWFVDTTKGEHHENRNR